MATPEFENNDKESLLDISSSDPNKEFWLIQWPQWPSNQSQAAPDFVGQELTLKLHRDGKLGAFESSSGKSYEFVSFASQGPDATVFQSSASHTKVVGKISRRVSLIHYPEPIELDNKRSVGPQFYQRSGASSVGPSRRTLTVGSGRGLYSSGVSEVTTPRSSQRSTSLPETGGSSHHKKKQDSQVTQGSSGRDHSGVSSLGSSGRDHSGVSSLGSAGHSGGRKSKKVKHEEITIQL